MIGTNRKSGNLSFSKPYRQEPKETLSNPFHNNNKSEPREPKNIGIQIVAKNGT